jgi:hypothetical protein
MLQRRVATLLSIYSTLKAGGSPRQWIVQSISTYFLKSNSLTSGPRDQINDLDFSYDGEFIAVAFSRSLEIVRFYYVVQFLVLSRSQPQWATETCECIHRVTQQVTPCRVHAAFNSSKSVLILA